MTYRGQVKGGVVVLEGEATLPEGRVVTIEPAPAAIQPIGIWAKLSELAGQARNLPKDAARNHDHYLYGTPEH